MDEQIQGHVYNGNHAGGFLAGLLIGGLAGAGVMLLLAPQSGEKMRIQIQQKAIELRDQTAKSVESVEDAVTQVRGKARRITAEIRQKAEELQKLGQDMIDDQKERSAEAVKAG